MLPGQLGQITDATVTPCKPYKQTTETHQCIMLTNPYQGVTRVFDATKHQFVLSPIAYYPLVIKTGQAPNQIARFNEQVFTLDPIDKAIYEIPSNFASPVKNASNVLAFTPNFFALGMLDTKLQAFISSSDTMLRYLPIGSSDSAQEIDIGYPIDQLQIDSSGINIVIASQSNLFISKLPWSPQKITFTANINAVTVSSKKVLIALVDQSLILIDLDSQTEIKTKLPAQGLAIYLPEGEPSLCCNGIKTWVAVLLSDGQLQYWPYENGTFGTPQTLNISSITGVSSYAFTNPVKLLGAQVENFDNDGLGCPRRLYLIYSGTMFASCEGSANVKLLDQMVY